MATSAIFKKSTRSAAERPIMHEVKLSVLLASKQHTECFIVCIARARLCFNCFKELTYEQLVKAYPFQVLPVHQLCHIG